MARCCPQGKNAVKSGASIARDGRKRSAIDLARTSTDPDERADSFKHDAGCREHGVAIRTDWAEMRTPKIVRIRARARLPGRARAASSAA